MADDSDDPDMAAERLEAALERIAQLAAAKAEQAAAHVAEQVAAQVAAAMAAAAVAEPAQTVPALDDPLPEPPAVDEEDLTADVAARLDSLIARLRDALGTSAA